MGFAPAGCRSRIPKPPIFGNNRDVAHVFKSPPSVSGPAFPRTYTEKNATSGASRREAESVTESRRSMTHFRSGIIRLRKPAKRMVLGPARGRPYVKSLRGSRRLRADPDRISSYLAEHSMYKKANRPKRLTSAAPSHDNIFRPHAKAGLRMIDQARFQLFSMRRHIPNFPLAEMGL